MKIRQSMLVTIMLCVLVVLAQSQEKKETKKSADDDDVIKVTSNLVSLDVIVKDKKGKAITDLKPEDFTVFENGVAQKIDFFDSTLSSGPEAQPTTATTTATGSTKPKPRAPTSFPRNIIALVLDGQSTEVANLKHVREGMVKYIRERISDSDSVALFSISGGLQLLQTFTQDKGKLIAAVEKAYYSSTVSKTSEARGLSEDIRAMRESIASGPELIGGTVPGPGVSYSMAAQALIARHVLEQYIALRSTLGAQQTRQRQAEHADGDREIKTWSFFFYVRGREIDRRAAKSKSESGIDKGGHDAIARFLDRRIGQANDHD